MRDGNPSLTTGALTGAGDAARACLAKAREYESYVVDLLRELIAIPSVSCNEGRLVSRLVAECRALDLPARVDRCGNFITELGSGPYALVYDAHMDTVGPGDLSAWPHDPYAGKVADGAVWGRGASDNKGALASMLTAMRIIRELGLDEGGGFRLQLIGVVEEEVSEGWAIGEAISSGAIQADAVVLGECTALNLARGHRGRAEFELTARGVACHGSSPWRGHNAIYDLAAWVGELRGQSSSLPQHDFLGPASLAVTAFGAASGSPNVIPEVARATVDRRTIPGETATGIAAEISAAALAAGVKEPAIRLVEYTEPSYTGLTKVVPKEYPAWEVNASHPLVEAGIRAVTATLGTAPAVGRWEFATDGVMTMGRLGVPTIGFGPGEEHHAHTVIDQVSIEHLVRAAAVYAVLPLFIAPRGTPAL